MLKTDTCIRNAELILTNMQPTDTRDKIAKAQVWALLGLVKVLQDINDVEQSPIDLTKDLP